MNSNRSLHQPVKLLDSASKRSLCIGIRSWRRRQHVSFTLRLATVAGGLVKHIVNLKCSCIYIYIYKYMYVSVYVYVYMYRYIYIY